MFLQQIISNIFLDEESLEEGVKKAEKRIEKLYESLFSTLKDIKDQKQNGRKRKDKVLDLNQDLGFLSKQKDFKIQTYKSDLPPLLDFFHKKDIQPCGWIKFNNAIKKTNSNYADKDF